MTDIKDVSHPGTPAASPWPVRFGLPAALVVAALASAVTAGWTSYAGQLTVAGLGPYGGPFHYSRAAALIAPLALAAALLLVGRVREAWPYLLPAGALLQLPALIVARDLTGTSAREYSIVTHTFAVGTALTVVAVLAAAQDLTRAGRIPAGDSSEREEPVSGIGAAVSAAVVAAPWVGTTVVIGSLLSRYQARPGTNLAIGVLGLIGAVAAMLAARARPLVAAEWVRTRPRVLVGGVLAALAPFLLPWVTTSLLARLTGVSVVSLGRNPSAVIAIIGSLVLVEGVVLALVGGVPALVGAATVALIQVGVVGPVVFGLSTTLQHGRVAVLAGAAGLVAGLLVALTRRRGTVAAVVAAGSALAVLGLQAATHGSPEKLLRHEIWLPGVLIVAGLVFLVAVTTATVTPMLAARGALPVALAALLPLLFLGGKGALALVPARDVQPALQLGIMQLGSSAVLLLLGAVVLAGITLFESGALVWRGTERDRA